jgi:hypothetical protein
LEQQRDLYLPSAIPLDNAQKARIWPYFSADLLDRVRFVQLKEERVALPEFFSEVRARGFEPPEFSHMDSLTFLDLIVFNEPFSDRALFHALVRTGPDPDSRASALLRALGAGFRQNPGAFHRATGSSCLFPDGEISPPDSGEIFDRK